MPEDPETVPEEQAVGGGQNNETATEISEGAGMRPV